MEGYARGSWAMRVDSWRLRGALGPALRRGLVAGIPVGATILFDLGLSAAELAGIGIGALVAGFVAFDSPSGRTRAAWQAGVAPFIALGGAVGAITGDSGVLATLTMLAVASAAALTYAVSLRLYVAALNVVLALLLAQGLTPETSDALAVFALAGAGALLQAAVSLLAALVDRIAEDLDPRAGLRSARAAIAANVGFDKVAFRHALRWGAAIAAGVAVYQALDLGPHGFWVPMTVLFVLRPTHDETWERILMRAAGTLAGLAIATPIAELIGGIDVIEALAIALTAALSYALLAIEYALFTVAITSFAVIFAHAFGQPAVDAADERALATAIGLVLCAVAFLVFRDVPETVRPRPEGGADAPSAT
jgi:hypothetical protein